MTENVIGVVEELVNNGKGKGSFIRVDGRKYGIYDPLSAKLDLVKEGDPVSFRFKPTEKEGITYKNIQGVVTKTTAPVGNAGGAVASSGGDLPAHYFVAKGYANLEKKFPVPVTHPDRAIIRQNSITNAVKLLTEVGFDVSDTDYMVEEVIKVAEKFETYSTGDEIRRKLEEHQKEMDA